MIMSNKILVEYQSGDAVILTQRYTDASGTLVDPASVVLRTKDPESSITTPIINRTAIGIYTAEFVVDVVGPWVYEWKTTGGNSAVVGRFDVLASPIDQASMGRVARLVRSLMPVTWDSLAKVDYYGLDLLLSRVQVAKASVLPLPLVESDESVFPLVMQDYLATCAAIEIIPAGIEYWMNQKLMVSATGTNETTSYTDRQLALLRSLLPQLTAKKAALAGNPNIIAFGNISHEAPTVSGNDDDLLITEDPFEFPEAFNIGGTASTSGGE
jgi:hypothetical protein